MWSLKKGKNIPKQGNKFSRSCELLFLGKEVFQAKASCVKGCPSQQEVIKVKWSHKNRALISWASLVAQIVKNLPAMQETPVQSLSQEDPLEKEIAIQSSILAWEIPWTEEPGRLQSMGLQRVQHNWAINIHTHMWIFWGVLLNCRTWFFRCGMGPESLHFY